MFQPGVSGNPKGRSRGSINWQSYSERASKLLESYEVEEIFSIADLIEAKKRVRVSTLDAMIIVNIASALRKDGKERERLLDRMLGKAIQRIGGENPGEGIRITQGAVLPLENLDGETLAEILEVLENARVRNAAPVLENVPQDNNATHMLIESVIKNPDSDETESGSDDAD